MGVWLTATPKRSSGHSYCANRRPFVHLNACSRKRRRSRRPEGTRIEALRAELVLEREEPSYQKKLDAGRRRRASEQEDYAFAFKEAIFRYLNFHPTHRLAAESLANLIAEHATPVGSGTVARTERIPIEERAEAATIAWLRHQTTGYDTMSIPREKGRRREVRRMLAQRSVQLLSKYRSGQPLDVGQCPLHRALQPWPPTRTVG